MSIVAYKAVWNYSESKGSERLVMLCLAEHANDEGYCWPSLTTIARETKVSKRHVTRAINSLQEQGEIKYRPGDGRGNKSEFWILLDALKGDNTPSFEAEKKGDAMSTKGDTLSKRVTFETAKGDMASPRTIIESSNNQNEPTITAANDSAIVFYENNIGGLTPRISELIYAAIDDHSEKTVVEAMQEAVTNNVRKWRYIEAILKNWKQNGRRKTSLGTNGNGRFQHNQTTPPPAIKQPTQAEIDALQAMISRGLA